MSILTEKLPSYVTVDGDNYPVNTDFRIWLRFYELMKKPDANSMCEAIILCYKGGKLPPSFSESYNALSSFFVGRSKGKKSGKPSVRLFDFTEDAELILSSFRSYYHIDLQKESMHWHTFLALLSGLGDGTPFMRVVALRGMDLSEIKDDKMRSEYRKRQRYFALSSESGCDDFAERLIKYI